MTDKQAAEVDLATASFKVLQDEAKARGIDIQGMKSKQELRNVIMKWEKENQKSEEENQTDTPEAPVSDEKPEDEDISESDQKPKPEVPEEPEDETDRPSDVSPDVEVKGINIRGPIDILDRNGQYIRTFCEETHGKGYRQLAEEFIKPTIADAKGKSATVPEENTGRKAVPHDKKIMEVKIVDKDNRDRGKFSREVYGIHFREKADASFNRIHGLPKLVPGEKVGTMVEDVSRPIECRIERVR